jgi:hypothetical protein
MKNITLLLLGLILIGITQSNAQEKKSYLYLEVNKNLPVRVQLNDKAIKNNRKGYIIIPQIKEGDNKLRFTFENPNFKTHTFTINSEAQKSQGLKLTRVANNKFVLQDVVNRKIIAENNSVSDASVVAKASNNNPVLASKQRAKKKLNAKKEGVVKVWEAGADGQATETSSRGRKIKKKKSKQAVVTQNVIKRTEPIVKKTTPTVPQKPKRVLAMYQNRQPLTAESAQKRYKNYSKIKRAKRRSARLSTLNKNVKTEKPDINKPKQDLKLKEAKRIAREKELAIEKRNVALQQKQAEAKRLKKQKIKEERILQKKQLKEQKRQLAIVKQELERKRAKRIEIEKLEAEKLRVEKAKIAKKKLESNTLEKIRTKKVKTPKRSRRERKNINIGEQVINSEPTSGKELPASARKNYETEDRIAPIRCAFSVKPERIADWTRKLPKKFDDEARVNYVNRKIDNKCISTNNLAILLGNMETQIGRFKLIRSVYPKIEDRANMDRLYKYFQSKSYIEKIKSLKSSIY